MRADVIIVGAGSAGCLLANRLSADPTCRVVLIEAGPEDDWFWIKVPVGYLFTIANPRTDWCFKTEPDPGLGQRSIHYARGRVIGGSSSINAMIYMRGQESDYARWVQATGDARWAWPQTLETYKALEDYFAGPNAWHGVGGEMRVEPARVKWTILDAWRSAAAEQGIQSIDEFNRGDNSGCAYFQMTQKRGRRWSMADAFLHPIRHRKNLTVLTGAQVLRVVTDDIGSDQPRPPGQYLGAWAQSTRQATGVEILHQGARHTIRASREVILSAGAVGSPHLLQLSGIGAPADLLQAGIPVLHELPGVGHNLHDHLQIRTVYRVKGCRTVNTLYRNPFTRLGMALQYALFRTGPLTMPPSTLGAFAKSSPAESSANLEWHVQPLSLPKFGEPLHPFNAITPSVCNLRPTSRGWIRAASPDPLAPPKIFCNYLSTQADREVAIAGLKLTRQIMSSAALQRFAPEELLPGASLHSDTELEQAARELGTTIFHPVGTCKMGALSSQGRLTDPSAVVDSDCRVQGVAHLRVVDASAMPFITSGNTNAPVMLIAEQAARSIIAPRQVG